MRTNKIYVSSSIPLDSAHKWDFALGQDSLNGESANRGESVSASGFSQPTSVHCTGSKLIVSDFSNHRVLIFDLPITSHNQAASIVIGQTDFTSNSANQGGSAGTSTLNQPTAVDWDGSRLFIADSNNNRILIFNGLPTSNGVSADFVLGQANFTTSSPATSQSRLRRPYDVMNDGNYLWVADRDNNRVLAWDMSVALSNGRNADLLFGQSVYTSNTANIGGSISGSTLRAPISVLSDGTKLYVFDKGNARVLVWNSPPTVSSTPADFALGQDTLTTGNNYHSVNSATKFSGLSQVMVLNNKLFVSEANNIRVYNSIPTSSGSPAADFVLGNSNFETNSGPNGVSGTVSANHFNMGSGS